MKKHYEPIKINAMDILLNRPGKADGRLEEVRMGCGIYQDRRFKKPKYKKNWMDEE